MSDTTASTKVPVITGYHHMSLTVSDVERSEEWYSRVFGFQRVMVEQHHGGDGYAIVMSQPDVGLFLGLDNHAQNSGEQFAEHRTGLDHLAIGVAQRSDLDDWAAHLDRLGVARSEINDMTTPFPYSPLIVRDPDNIQLELIWM